MNLARSKSLIKHLLIIEESKVRRRIILEESQYSLGRKASNSIILNSQQVSRKHATLLRKTKSQLNQYSYWIFDGDLEGNKSNNGIYVNGEKCLVHELQDGDLINFGCEVNASYHILASTETSYRPLTQFNSSSEKSQEIEGKSTSPSEKYNIPLISEPYITVNIEDTLSDQIYIDSLTQLPNKSLFNEYLSIAIGNARQNQKPMAVLYFDIAQLRVINEKFGESIGDQVLQEFGKQLKSCLRSGDIIARWGGDEFTILLPQINTLEDVPKVCDRILAHTTKPLGLDKQSLKIQSNVGFAIYPLDGNEERMLVQKAEASLEENKQKIKAQTRRQKATIQAKNSKLSQIETLLQQALDNTEFSLYYQPQVNTTTKTIDGVEALLRWYHPQFGAIAPNQFIPWVEKLNLVIPLTQWIIETVCQQHQALQKQGFGDLPISINLSSYQLQHPDLLKMLLETLSDSKLEPNLLLVEITENTLLENPENAFRVLYELKQLGVKGAIDDFGSGYTSARHLQQFPFEQVKIAQSLLLTVKKSPEELAMIAAVIALGRAFNLKVVAEGVETQKQFDLLRKLGCEVMQGYLFSEPLNSKDLTQFLSLHYSTLFDK